jgi:hypothetical protein
MIQQLTIKLSIEPDLQLAAIDTDCGIYSFQGQEAVNIASFFDRYIDTGLDIPNTTMGSTNKNQESVSQLLADTKSLLRNSFSEDEYNQVLSTIEQAESRGLLGADKPFDDCLGELVNIANDILRNRNFDEVEVSSIARQPKALYVYVALVAVGLISA